jgi:hypothetical protein
MSLLANKVTKEIEATGALRVIKVVLEERVRNRSMRSKCPS